MVITLHVIFGSFCRVYLPAAACYCLYMIQALRPCSSCFYKGWYHPLRSWLFVDFDRSRSLNEWNVIKKDGALELFKESIFKNTHWNNVHIICVSALYSYCSVHFVSLAHTPNVKLYCSSLAQLQIEIKIKITNILRSDNTKDLCKLYKH